MFSTAEIALFSAISKLFSKDMETRINTNEMLCEANKCTYWVMSKVSNQSQLSHKYVKHHTLPLYCACHIYLLRSFM